ncbi:UDP-3-O-acyl-N-acetylglucosamine deacetylase [Methylobacterium bullatum]|uniref:UDP-3-O-acyl-N-acetylglucosamine deacetylase n=1 Tax=Methylobacterium bullatum TaxID=570505 RepID=UPI0027E4EC6A|nr:UDP-3-O-acyl-N-acetylglucosamine deacetylase [Methylobacterium bullatum]
MLVRSASSRDVAGATRQPGPPRIEADVPSPWWTRDVAANSPAPSIQAAHDVAPASARQRQATLSASVRLTGYGLHTGRRVTVTVAPAGDDHGIVFRRDLGRGRTVDVPALWTFRETQPLCTALRSPHGPLVRTVEHLLAALYAHRIDNALVSLDAEELPIFDGGALPWCEGLRASGRTESDAQLRSIRVLRPVEVRQDHRTLRIAPADALHLSGRLELSRFDPMHWSGTITPEVFTEQLAPSRSFGRAKWAIPAKIYGMLLRKPLLRGANLSSTACIVGGQIIGGMTVPDEPVRHRMLDLIGDLALAGYPILGRIEAAHTGHELNHALVAALMNDPAAWELT